MAVKAAFAYLGAVVGHPAHLSHPMGALHPLPVKPASRPRAEGVLTVGNRLDKGRCCHLRNQVCLFGSVCLRQQAGGLD